ncbi:uncharacterized protein LOC110721652 [Chenopodium quinoa]|uniref:FYR C-terminal domain-containing protein n=1 Tax=Chenopodium quinoa TaxID=63459 RepID=A0A803KVL9_CHEQI|nr:uncharacterized protein LOC110721652 [Chenopodium quinoa]
MNIWEGRTFGIPAIRKPPAFKVTHLFAQLNPSPKNLHFSVSSFFFKLLSLKLNATSMVKSDYDSKSDGLEILSIGALYTGPWDKKYWSSSRGKDRYPYPIGYQALRTHNGLTYKMEIHEGSKGPIFQITSNDKQFGSGETPDRAWENFQKKCLTRIKLWHGKRSSGKIDGVEFFGFKNALVQRLLRELVATVNDASDRSSVFTNCNEASPKVHDAECLMTQKYPDLRSCLEKTTVTGKRSRTSRGTDTKLACKSGHERRQPPHLGIDTKALYSSSGKMDIDEPLISCALSDHHDKGALQVTSNMELGDNTLLSAHGLPVNSHEVPGDPKTESCLIQVQSEPPLMETCVAASSLGVDMPQDEKSLDRQCIEIQAVGLPVATQEGSQKVQVIPDLLKPRSPLLRDSQVSHAGDLFAPDSSDTQQEIACAPNSGSYSGEQAIAKIEPVGEMAFSEEAIMGSHSEEGSYLNGNSEKSDFDSVDEDIAKSMMALLVPLAVPLLTYSSRKRRKTKRHKNLPSAVVKSSGGKVACSGSNGQTKAHLSSAIGSGLSMMENLKDVVQDSVENDRYEDHVANELPTADNAQAVDAHLQKEKQEPDKRGSSPALDVPDFSAHQKEITGIKENLRYVPDSVEDDQYEDRLANESPPSDDAQIVAAPPSNNAQCVAAPPSDNAQAVAAHLQKEKQEPDKRGSSPVLHATDFSSHQNEITGSKENFRNIVPDSVENDQYEDHVAKELPPSDNAEAVAVHLQEEKQEPDKRGSSPVFDATNFSSLHYGITDFKENLRYVVPDSLENDLYEDHEANELQPSNNAEVVAAHLQKEKQEPDKRGSTLVLDANKLSSRQNENSKFKEIFFHDELQKINVGMSQNDCAFALQSAVPCQLSVPLDCVATCSTPDDQCKNADKNSKSIENCSKYTDLEIMPDCKGPRFISVPEKQQCSPENIHPKMDKYGATLSESIICRDIWDKCVPEINQNSGNSVSTNSCQDSAFGDSDSSKALFSRSRIGGHISNLQNGDMEDALAQDCVLQDQALRFTFSKNDVQLTDGGNFHVRKSEAYIDKDRIGNQHSDSVYQLSDQGKGFSPNCASHIQVDEAEINPSCLNKQDFNDQIGGSTKLIGCYSHPMRISSVMLTRTPQEIYICVSCGLLEEKRRDLFLYKLSTVEPSSGSPFMVGHTSMSLPSLKDEFGREVAVDKFGLQFTPDASSLVIADSIRVPYCREKNLHCLCPQCETSCFEENAVKIVQIKLGYVSLVVKLKTIFSVHCLIVCEPDRLIAVDESGRIYIWIMNSTWSEQTEVYVIPSYDFLPSRIVELKRIPKSASMVVGHNGYGEFSLWDIVKRTLVSQFSASASSVIDFLPVSLFRYPSKGLSHDKVVIEEFVRNLKEATMLWFSRHDVANISCPMEGEDTAIWLLLCTSSDTRAQTSFNSSNHHLNSDGCWRLGLLMKNMVTLGAALNSSITAIGTSSSTGIIGTQGGHVYTWELATGRKLEALHDLEGKEVLHIAITDESTSSAVAVAGDGGQLCVYLRS